MKILHGIKLIYHILNSLDVYNIQTTNTEEVIENVDMTKVKYVDFVWYNRVDMPIYYDEKEIDDFYDEL